MLDSLNTFRLPLPYSLRMFPIKNAPSSLQAIVRLSSHEHSMFSKLVLDETRIEASRNPKIEGGLSFVRVKSRILIHLWLNNPFSNYLGIWVRYKGGIPLPHFSSLHIPRVSGLDVTTRPSHPPHLLPPVQVAHVTDSLPWPASSLRLNNVHLTRLSRLLSVPAKLHPPKVRAIKQATSA